MKYSVLAKLAPVWAAALLGALPLHAADPTPASLLPAAQAVRSALVRVEYHLQTDKGEMPQGGALKERCPNCGQYHVDRTLELIGEERPLEIPGYLVGPDRVITAAPQVHPRFIKAIKVRGGGELRDGRRSALTRHGLAWQIDLAAPMPSSLKPLAFQPEAPAPHYLAVPNVSKGDGHLMLRPLSLNVTTRDTGETYAALSAGGLVVDQAGQAVGLPLNGELPLDGSWKGAPAQWDWIQADAWQREMADLEKATARGLLRVELGFRSPKKNEATRRRYDSDDESQDGKATERNVVGALLSGNRVLVLASLKPKMTARLQSIRVFPPEGPPVAAKFTASLKDYGCLLVTLEQPMAPAFEVATRDIREFRNEGLRLAQITVQGESRVAHFMGGRFQGFQAGPRQRMYPEMIEGQVPDYVFDGRGQLVALPVPKREKPTTERQYGSEGPLLTPAAYLLEALAQLEKSADPANVPLSEAEENRLAWLGVELQALNKDLARANNVSDQTRDGDTGALVTYVYPDSPAAQAGVEAGWILLRLRTDAQPNPIEIKLEDERMYGDNFPWEQLGEVSEQYFDRLPSPWPAVDNTLNRLLTDLGISTRFEADFMVNGKLASKPFTAASTPPYYESASRHKSEAMGLTVRDLTYEVRRYLQKKTDEPGVVVSKVERGSKASVAGIKPFELITHVNDQPVASVKAFQELTAAGGEYKLSIKRMAKGRIVTLKAAAEAEAKAAGGKDQTEAEPKP